MSRKVSPALLREIAKGGANKAEGAHNLYKFIHEGLESKKFTVDQICYADIANALGIVDHENKDESIHRFVNEGRNYNPELRAESYFHESNPGLLSNAFQVVTQELLSSAMIEGYEKAPGVADRLVTRMPSTRAVEKIPGFTALDGAQEVAEGHPYPETGFTDKYVTTSAYKFGRIISVSEEALLFDQTGLINIRMRDLGDAVRQDRERFILRGVQDADYATKPVYRPMGTAEQLYDGTNYNLIGTNGVTGYTSAIALADWHDLDEVLKMRATKIVDDRVDGTPKPISGLNTSRCVLLVPEALRTTAWYIKNSTGQELNTNSAVDRTSFTNPVQGFVGDIISSVFVDEVSSTTWYYGDFSKQFIWQEIWPLQTFVQGASSEAAFERDTVMRLKVRYYGGLAARDSYYVTKVLGA